MSNRIQDSRRSFLQDNYRKTPLLLTVAFHLGGLLLTIVGPLMMPAQTPRIPEVYTVNLYSVQEAAPPSPPAAVPKVVKVATPAAKKAVAPPPVKNDAVSLSPIRRRLAKEQKEKEARRLQDELRTSKMEQVILNLRREQAEKNLAEAEKAAETAKKEAAGKIADLYKKNTEYEARDRRPVAGDATATSPRTGGSDQQQLDALAGYRARLFDHISPHWQLPELQGWDANLRAVIVMQVKRDGTVVNNYFEKRSGNPRFDQYARKAIDNARPLPPFPLEMNEKSEEIAVTFSPGGLL
jgi:colicin import membrane protein